MAQQLYYWSMGHQQDISSTMNLNNIVCSNKGTIILISFISQEKKSIDRFCDAISGIAKWGMQELHSVDRILSNRCANLNFFV